LDILSDGPGLSGLIHCAGIINALDEGKLRAIFDGKNTSLFALRHQRRPAWAMVEKTAAFRQRRAADTARWRERLHRGAAVYPVEVDGTTFDLMERFGGLKTSKEGDRRAVAIALGRLLRRALEALLREQAASRR